MQVKEQTVYLNLLVGNTVKYNISIYIIKLHYYIAIVRVSINLEL